MSTPLNVTIEGIFCGRTGSTLDDGTPSGIFKAALRGSARLGALGLAADFHADRSVHGGIDKALHHFPADHYQSLKREFPTIEAALIPGSIGENLSTQALGPRSVCIGDVFAVGTARIQLTQPRRPCWKIDQRYGVHRMAAWIAGTGLTGWYYRVIETGVIAAGDRLTLLERDPRAPSVAAFHATVSAPRPPPEALEALQCVAGLPESWVQRLARRADWLRRNA